MKGSVWILGIQKEIKNTELHYHFVCTDAIVCTVSAENWSTGRVDPCMLWPLMLFSESTLKKKTFLQLANDLTDDKNNKNKKNRSAMFVNLGHVQW